jgi:bacterioferritin
VRAYNSAIALAHEVVDQSSVDLLIKILKMEEDHLDWLEAQIDQITQLGIQAYLAEQLH